MILDYYHDVRGLNVKDNSPYTNYYRLINHLYEDMRSGILGTSLGNYAAGMEYHMRESTGKVEYPITVMANGIDTYTKSLKYRAAIESNNPVAIRFDFFDFGGNDINWHFVAGIGFNLNWNSSGNLAAIYRNPDGSSNTGTYYFDWTDNAPDFSFSYFDL